MESDEIFERRKQIYLGHSQLNEIDLGLRIYRHGDYEEAEKADREFKRWKENYIIQNREIAERKRLMDNK